MFEIMDLCFGYDIKDFGSFMLRIGLLVGVYTSIKMGMERRAKIRSLVIIGFAWLCCMAGTYVMVYVDH